MIIVEGILVLHNPQLREHLNMKVRGQLVSLIFTAPAAGALET